MWKGTPWAVVALMLGSSLGCLKINRTFECRDDLECSRGAQGGFCTAGFCAFSDPGCEGTQQRYGELAGDLSGECVSPPDAGPPDAQIDAALDPPIPFAVVVAGDRHTCAVSVDAELYCWGDNQYGQLGLGDLDQRTSPTKVPGLSGLNTASLSLGLLAAGGAHTCVIARSDAVPDKDGLYCWGSNNDGQVGLPPDAIYSTPQYIDLEGNDPQEVATGLAHTCARTATKTYCWGLNDYGQVGNNDKDVTATTPQPLAALYRRLAAGKHHTCATNNANAVYCWGDNSAAQMGNAGLVNAFYAVPTAIAFTAVNELSAGGDTTCAEKDFKSYCWGANDTGQLGKGSTDPLAIPTIVNDAGTAPPNEVRLGDKHACGYSAEAVYCWGLNDQGQLGIDSTDPKYTPTTTYHADLNPAYISIALGQSHTCVVTSETPCTLGSPESCTQEYIDSRIGLLHCWGLNDQGQLGRGNTTSSLIPQRIIIR